MHTNQPAEAAVKKPRGSQTADRAIQVLLAFTTQQDWGVSELSRHLGLDKSVVQRLLITLAERRLVISDPRTRRYLLGPTAITLGKAAEQSTLFEILVRPYLTELTAQTGQSSIFSRPSRALALSTLAVDAPGRQRYSSLAGDPMPGNMGASGHAIFAWYPDEEINTLFAGDGPAQGGALVDRYRQIRRDGYSVSDGEWDPTVRAVAAPCFARDQVIGSITVIGPREEMEAITEQCTELVVQAAKGFSRVLIETP